MRYSAPELLVDARAFLGEGPSWEARNGLLTWVDIRAGRLHVYHPIEGSDRSYEVGSLLGCAVPTRSGNVILAMKEGLASLDLSSAEVSRIAPLEAHLPGNRFNDGKCSPEGRFLAGSMDDAEEQASGSLYSLSPDGSLQTLLTGLRISNGMTWSPDRRTFYFIDTPTHEIQAFDYDAQSGAIANPRVAVRVPPEFGWPDGMTSDAEGRLWVAMWAGAALTVWQPENGQLLERIPMPAKNVSSCVFGGAQRNELYVTSARKGVSPADLTAFPATGGLFRLQTDATGAPTFVFQD